MPDSTWVQPGSPSTDVAFLLPKSDRYVTLTTMEKVKERRRGASKISSKNQITIPAEALRSAGLEVGDRVVAHADGAGRVILEREHDVVAEFAGALTGAYLPRELDAYLHRVGRTARAGKRGLVVNLVTPRDAPLLALLDDGSTAPAPVKLDPTGPRRRG